MTLLQIIHLQIMYPKLYIQKRNYKKNFERLYRSKCDAKSMLAFYYMWSEFGYEIQCQVSLWSQLND